MNKYANYYIDDGYLNQSSKLPLALLIFPPVYDFALFDLFLKPYSLLCIGRWLLKAGFRIKLINALDISDNLSIKKWGKPVRRENGTGKFFRQVIKKPGVLADIPRYFARYGMARESLKARIQQERPQIILISSGMTYWYHGVREVVSLCRQIFPRVPVTIGGIYATLCKQHLQKQINPDYIVTGQVFPQLNNILNKHSLPYLNQPVKDDPLLFPGIYNNAAVIRLNSGCPLRCLYCASHTLCGGFKTGNPRLTFSLVQKANRYLGIKNFAFYDDALLFDKHAGIIPFLKMVIEARLDVYFYLPNGVHISFIDEELAKLMKKAGFKEIRLGFESSDPVFHQKHGDKFRISGFNKAIHFLTKAGFSIKDIGVYILAGLPAQHQQQVETSIRYTAELGVRVYVAEYSPIPGTPLWAQSVKESRFPLEEEPLTHNNSIFPLQWEKFTVQDMQRLKLLAKKLSRADI